MADSISASMEDYLEVIFEIAGDGGVARVRDIATRKGVSMPSVNGAIKRLARQDFIRHDRYEYVELTPRGKRRAGRLAGRHALIKRFLTEVLSVDEETADRDACAIEHHVSQTSVDALIRYFDS